jgi:hypothetical protein
MAKDEPETSNQYPPPVAHSVEVIRQFRENIASGKHWYIALLEAIRQWTDELEEIQGRTYHYLIEDEAFDLLLLAERLCEAVHDVVPEDEKYAFLFRNKPPLELSPEQLRELLGQVKHRRFLNYFYGITVEEALIQAVREEVRKERRSNGLSYRQAREEEEAFSRVYGDTEAELLKQFRRAKHRHVVGSLDLTEMKEFTYWCFKFRIKTAEKARVASDTQKGLEWLRKNGIRSYI